MKVLYVVSTLKSSGPTNQLFNIISNLPPQFKAKVLTLSAEESDSQMPRFKNAGIEVTSLLLSRIQGAFKGKARLLQVINDFSPEIIHSQGLRPDTLLAKCKLNQPWVMTSRNYPFADYPMKFGKLKGLLMAYSHIAVMRKCRYLVSCSKSIATQLAEHGIQSVAIQNGVAFTDTADAIKLDTHAPVFITVGSLISRKNTAFLINAFNKFREQKLASLYVLGEGPEEAQLKAMAGKDVYFTGNVDNVRAYLLQADYFLSASLSEGLPNTVLEALAAGLPCLLSDIPPHCEIAQEDERCVGLFALEQGVNDLAAKLLQIDTMFEPVAKELALKLATGTFSATAMSEKYQQLYIEAVESVR
ncbi:glycosyltransferase family 4 protein [Chromatiaceae bacterium AAb-1]|nr:glycosyltransferase family 4 protein [Chromatiaceae bacterium AAb-1]